MLEKLRNLRPALLASAGVIALGSALQFAPTHSARAYNDTVFKEVFPEDFGAYGDNSHDDIDALEAARDYVLAHNGTFALRSGVAYKISRKFTIDVGLSTANLQSDGFKMNIHGGTDINGTSITSGPAFEILCTGIPNGCDNFIIDGRLTIKGSATDGPVCRLGADDQSDQLVDMTIDYLACQNFAASGANTSAAIVNRVIHSRLRFLSTFVSVGPTSFGYGLKLAGAVNNWIDYTGGINGSHGVGMVLDGIVTSNTIGIFSQTGLSNSALQISSADVQGNNFLNLRLSGSANGINATAGSGNYATVVYPVGPSSPYVSLVGMRLGGNAGPVSVGSCNGSGELGSTGTCQMSTGLDGPESGYVALNVAGTSPAATGQFTLTLPPFGSNWACTFNPRNASGGWDDKATVKLTNSSATSITAKWQNNGSALSAGFGYSIAYQCKAIG